MSSLPGHAAPVGACPDPVGACPALLDVYPALAAADSSLAGVHPALFAHIPALMPADSARAEPVEYRVITPRRWIENLRETVLQSMYVRLPEKSTHAPTFLHTNMEASLRPQADVRRIRCGRRAPPPSQRGARRSTSAALLPEN